MTDAQRADRLCELNVLEQVANVCHTTIVQDAWRRGQTLTVHGWIYCLQDGLLRDLGLSVTQEDGTHRRLRARRRRAVDRRGHLAGESITRARRGAAVLEAALRDKVGGCPSFATSRLAPATPSCSWAR